MNKLLGNITDPILLLKYMPLFRGEDRPDLLESLGIIQDYSEGVTDTIVETSGCYHTNLVDDDRLADTICTDCGVVMNGYEKTNIGYNEYKNFNFIKPSIYKPVDHLILILTEFQCARVDICKDMIEDVKYKLGEQASEIKQVRKVLRKLGYKQHYLLLPSIMNAIDPGKFKPVRLTSREVRLITTKFSEYLCQFEALRKSGESKRKNLLNYHYVIKRICQFIKLPNLKEMSIYFHLPSGVKTMEEHDRMWNMIQFKSDHHHTQELI